MAQAKASTGSTVGTKRTAAHARWVWRGRLEEIEEAMVRKAAAGDEAAGSSAEGLRVALDVERAGATPDDFRLILAYAGYDAGAIDAEVALVKRRLADNAKAWGRHPSPPLSVAA